MIKIESMYPHNLFLWDETKKLQRRKQPNFDEKRNYLI
jgi:hypothetical protein